jgi:hypothetical protein
MAGSPWSDTDGERPVLGHGGARGRGVCWTRAALAFWALPSSLAGFRANRALSSIPPNPTLDHFIQIK